MFSVLFFFFPKLLIQDPENHLKPPKVQKSSKFSFWCLLQDHLNHGKRCGLVNLLLETENQTPGTTFDAQVWCRRTAQVLVKKTKAQTWKHASKLPWSWPDWEKYNLNWQAVSHELQWESSQRPYILQAPALRTATGSYRVWVGLRCICPRTTMSCIHLKFPISSIKSLRFSFSLYS